MELERFTREHLTGDLRCDRFERDGRYQNLRHLGTDDWMLFWTTGGRGIVRCPDGRPLANEHYHCCLIAPGTRQHYGTDPDIDLWRFCWAHFQPRPPWLPLLQLPQAAPGIVHLRLAEEALLHAVDRDCQAMVDAYRSHSPYAVLRAQNALERVLISLHEYCGHPSGGHPGLERALRHIDAHRDRPHGVPELAALAGLSPSRFAHLFRQRVGLPPVAFVERCRLQRAAELLNQCDWPIAQVAAAVGYDDPLYFSARFRKLFGSAPRTWRKLVVRPPASERARGRSSSSG